MKDAQSWLQSFRPSSNQENRGVVVSVSSGKGGVGKTSVGLRLAQEFVKEKKSVCFIDADWNLSNSLIQLGLPLNDNLKQFAQGKISFRDALVEYEGLSILPGLNGDLEMHLRPEAMTETLEQAVEDARSCFDIIFIDAPAGSGSDVLSLIGRSDARVLVVNPDMSSLTDGYGLMKLSHESMAVKDFLLIINKAHSTKQAGRTALGLMDTLEKFTGGSLKFLGHVPFSPAFNQGFGPNVTKNAASQIIPHFSKIKKRLADNLSAGV